MAFTIEAGAKGIYLGHASWGARHLQGRGSCDRVRSNDG